MTIVTPTAPPAVIEGLKRGLRRLARISASVVPRNRVEVARGLPLYEAGAALDDSADSVQRGWRFVVVRGETLFWADMIDEAVDTVLSGPATGTLLDVARQAEDSGIDGEARVLTYPVLDAAALWITGETDRFWQFAPDIGAPCDLAALLGRWRSMAEGLALHSRDALD